MSDPLPVDVQAFFVCVKCGNRFTATAQPEMYCATCLRRMAAKAKPNIVSDAYRASNARESQNRKKGLPWGFREEKDKVPEAPKKTHRPGA